MKTYELSISENYVSKWGINEAIREIMQNAIDSEHDGNEMSISYNGGVLSISNYGASLDISTLVLGSSDKTNGGYIGKFGEGYKLALIVLLRLGLGIKIYTNQQCWDASFRESEKFGIKTLHVDVEDNEADADDQITFEITGLNYDTFKEIRAKNIAIMANMGHSIGELEESEYGDILLSPDYIGMMFVDGLYIQSDKTFQYGYNFKHEFVDLDRDRKAINYYELQELTARALTTQQNFRLLHLSMSKSSIDTKRLTDVVDDISDEYAENFAKDFMDRNEIDEETFVGTKKEVQVSGYEKVFEAPKSISKIFAKGVNKEYEYSLVEDKLDSLSSMERGWEYYRGSNYETLIEYCIKNMNPMSDYKIKQFIQVIDKSSFYPSYYRNVKKEVLKDTKKRLRGKRGVEIGT